MIEVSYENIILLLWAGIATASWLQTRDELNAAKKMLFLILEDEKARDQIVEAHTKFMRERKDA